jgi:P27 family predicted phage terminase small subunit
MSNKGPVSRRKPVIKFRAGVPDPGTWMDDHSREEYFRVAEELEAAGAEPQQVDAALLGTYAQAVTDCSRLTREIREEGEIVTLPNGIRTANPKVNVKIAAQKHMLACIQRLGFSPVDRARVQFDPVQRKRFLDAAGAD